MGKEKRRKVFWSERGRESAAERKGDGFESDPLFNRQPAEFLKE